MTNWLAQVDQLLYDGETVQSRVEVGEGGVVVTTHRVLVFTPDREGANYTAVDRPNVSGVTERTVGNGSLLEPALKGTIVGGFLLAGGYFVSLDSLVGGIDLTGTGQIGLGGFLGLMQQLLTALALVDELMTVAGAGAIILATALFGLYLLSRERVIVVGVEGREDVHMTAPDDDVTLAIEDALTVDPGSAGQSAPQPPEEPPG
jgi:hypothetical protein